MCGLVIGAMWGNHENFPPGPKIFSPSDHDRLILNCMAGNRVFEAKFTNSLTRTWAATSRFRSVVVVLDDDLRVSFLCTTLTPAWPPPPPPPPPHCELLVETAQRAQRADGNMVLVEAATCTDMGDAMGSQWLNCKLLSSRRTWH
jgi:hypothetical protein